MVISLIKNTGLEIKELYRMPGLFNSKMLIPVYLINYCTSFIIKSESFDYK